jgi:hypothetical protein
LHPFRRQAHERHAGRWLPVAQLGDVKRRDDQHGGKQAEREKAFYEKHDRRYAEEYGGYRQDKGQGIRGKTGGTGWLRMEYDFLRGLPERKNRIGCGLHGLSNPSRCT